MKLGKRFARLATAPGRFIVRRLCAWKLDELRRYESLLAKLARSPSPMSGARADEVCLMIRQLKGEIRLLEGARERAR